MDSLGLVVLGVPGDFLFFLLPESSVYCWIFFFVVKNGLTMDADTDTDTGMDIDIDALHGHGHRAWAWTLTPCVDMDTGHGDGHRS
jgi:hypothetical protein